MNWDLKYGELAKDADFVNRCEDLKKNLLEIQKVLATLLPLKAQYDKMSRPSQIELDLFFAFTLNSMYWVYLRIQGQDPSKHPIKDELQRIQAAMQKWEQVKDREKRPEINLEAAKRFIRSGLYDPYHDIGNALNKKTRFNDDDK